MKPQDLMVSDDPAGLCMLIVRFIYSSDLEQSGSPHFRCLIGHGNGLEGKIAFSSLELNEMYMSVMSPVYISILYP